MFLGNLVSLLVCNSHPREVGKSVHIKRDRIHLQVSLILWDWLPFLLKHPSTSPCIGFQFSSTDTWHVSWLDIHEFIKSRRPQIRYRMPGWISIYRMKNLCGLLNMDFTIATSVKSKLQCRLMSFVLFWGCGIAATDRRYRRWIFKKFL